MDKKELVAEISKRTNQSTKEVSACISTALEVIVDAMKQEDYVRLKGFGTFHVQESPERQGIDPSTLKLVNYPAKKRVKFRGGSNMTL